MGLGSLMKLSNIKILLGILPSVIFFGSLRLYVFILNLISSCSLIIHVLIFVSENISLATLDKAGYLVVCQFSIEVVLESGSQILCLCSRL